MNFSNNVDIEEMLEKLPDEVAQALLNWRKATLDRERVEAKLHLDFKGRNPDKTATELRHMVNDTNERYEAVLAEISFESVYNAKYETLMSLKKRADLRTAY